jgi:hypothetical protein
MAGNLIALKHAFQICSADLQRLSQVLVTGMVTNSVKEKQTEVRGGYSEYSDQMNSKALRKREY